MFNYDKCTVTTDSNKKLKSHIESQHPKMEDSSSSPDPSPPRKKPVRQPISENKSHLIKKSEDTKHEVENMEQDENEKETDNKKKEDIIESQAKLIAEQAKELEKVKSDNSDLIKSIEATRRPTNKVSQEFKPIPDHLSPVQSQHLNDLLGIRMKCDGNPGGDCLSSCTTMHLSSTKDNSERNRVNRKINNHIADNYDQFYSDMIPLPYSETVGVGQKARQVTCATREELLDFLRSEDSLCAYSNSQELLVIANMLNIKIHIFTYGIGGDNKRWGWNSIFPDQKMSGFSEFNPGTVPDMLLYHSDNNHYDLLVEDNSRLAVLGFISLDDKKEFQKEVVQKVAQKEVNQKELGQKELHRESTSGGDQLGESREEQWKTVTKSRRKSAPNLPSPSLETKSTKEAQEVEEDPPKKKECAVYNCQECDFRGSGVQELKVHMKSHEESDNAYYCEACQQEFDRHTEYREHNKKYHSKQWNCDNCDFQAATRLSLMNHCKKTAGHKPSRGQRSKSGILECYTCKSEFRSYHDLMEHRKEEHPSHKTCRYFIKGECLFSSEEC